MAGVGKEYKDRKREMEALRTGWRNQVDPKEAAESPRDDMNW